MKLYFHLFILLTTFNQSFSQKLLGEKNTIEITQKYYYADSDFKELERKYIQVFDKKGRLIKNIEFGFHHYYNLNLVGEVTCYEYQKDNLISQKMYRGEEAFKSNRVDFYCDYTYDKSNLKNIKNTNSNTFYVYDKEKRTVEWTKTSHDSSSIRKFFSKYDNNNNLIEQGEIGNWTKKFTRDKDTIKVIEYNFDFPKKGDTTKKYTSEIYSKGKILYRNKRANVTYTAKYTYSNNEQLESVVIKMEHPEVNDIKRQFIYFPNGIIKQILLYEMEKEEWILNMRIDFELAGNQGILNKKEKNKINDMLTDLKSWME